MSVQNSNNALRKFKEKFSNIFGFFHGNPPAIIGGLLITMVLIGALMAPVLATHNPNKRVARPHMPPSADHILGTTRSGRDVYSQVLHGARKSLT
ncbi:ABC transporter permease, partial [Pseudomonadota bacterium]